VVVSRDYSFTKLARTTLGSSTKGSSRRARMTSRPRASISALASAGSVTLGRVARRAACTARMASYSKSTTSGAANLGGEVTALDGHRRTIMRYPNGITPRASSLRLV